MIPPLLANVYLHEVLDLWFHREVLPRLRGRAFLVRYADDFVIAFAREDDARRVHEVLPKRLPDTDWNFIPRRRGCWTFVVRDIGAMMILRAAICLASHTIGASHDVGHL